MVRGSAWNEGCVRSVCSVRVPHHGVDLKKKKQPDAGGVPETVTLTVGTAGHIDHGKTELIKFLTGCDTDRLPEEKARGMTIDLGFATCELPNHRRVGIVDVPGHERFIHNMVAGAAGIDTVLLVVAADDGVMPQTIEHFHIVRLLGVKSGMIAVTKTDLVTPERVTEVSDQVKDLVAGSFLDGCPVMPVSAKTGAGFEGFYDAFVATVDRTAERECSGPFLMHVERSFVLKGLGTIVSGIPRTGEVRTAEELELLPAGKSLKVRGIQVYGQDAGRGRAGECVALRLGGLSADEIGRGMVLACPGYFVPSRFINVRFHSLPWGDKPLQPRAAVRFHIGTSDVHGHIVFPELTPLQPGAESYAQVQLKEPVTAAPGDFFVLRLLSPVRTIGGGYVISTEEMRLRRRAKEDWIANCRAHENAFGHPESALEYVLDHTGTRPAQASELAKMSFVNVESAGKHIASLVEKGKAIEMPGGRYIGASVLESACREIVDALNRLHDERPLDKGFGRKKLFPRLCADRLVTEKALATLEKSGEVVVNSQGFHLDARAATLSESQAAIAKKICDLYRKEGLSSPRRDELPQRIGAPGPVLDPIFDHLEQSGEVVTISDKVVLHRECLEEAKDKLIEYIRAHGSIETRAFVDLLATTRKYAIPILEYWDGQGVTRRVGNERVLRE